MSTVSPFEAPQASQSKPVQLSTILTAPQLTEVLRLTKLANSTSGKLALRDYLHSIEEQLLAKNVLPDYLYYVLCAMFKL